MGSGNFNCLITLNYFHHTGISVTLTEEGEIYRVTGIYEKIDQYIKLNKIYAAGKIILEYLSMAWVSILMLT